MELDIRKENEKKYQMGEYKYRITKIYIYTIKCCYRGRVPSVASAVRGSSGQ